VAVTAVAGESLARYYFLKGFSISGNAESRQAAHRLLHGTGTLRRWRIAAAVTIVVSIICFFAIML
jgi:hypothetical protein